MFLSVHQPQPSGRVKLKLSHPVRMSIIKKINDNNASKDVGEENLYPGRKKTHTKKKNPKIGLLCDPVILLLGIYSRDSVCYHRDSNIYCCSSHNTQEMKPAWMPVSRGMDNEKVVHAHNGILFCLKEK